MPKISYEAWKPQQAAVEMVAKIDAIIAGYLADGYDLTLRQVYYQLVAKDLFPDDRRWSWTGSKWVRDPNGTKNADPNYKWLGDLVSKGRRAGMLDWNAIVDRTRNLRSLGTWESPSQIVEAVAQQFRYDLWKTQPNYIEVWFEKDALMGVFERAANRWRVPFFSCRGYTSDSEVWSAARRLATIARRRNVTILHFGDHDPSGIDMTRDIEERLALFGAVHVDVQRLALNMDQVEEYQPPPNPGKEADPRFADYLATYGDESWELDALEPRVLGALVEKAVRERLDLDEWKAAFDREVRAKAELSVISEEYERICNHPVRKERILAVAEDMASRATEDAEFDEEGSDDE